MPSRGNGCRLASADNVVFSVDPEMHLARKHRNSLLLARMEVLSGNLAVGAKRIVDLERLGGRLQDPKALAGDWILENLFGHGDSPPSAQAA